MLTMGEEFTQKLRCPGRGTPADANADAPAQVEMSNSVRDNYSQCCHRSLRKGHGK